MGVFLDGWHRRHLLVTYARYGLLFETLGAVITLH